MNTNLSRRYEVVAAFLELPTITVSPRDSTVSGVISRSHGLTSKSHGEPKLLRSD